MNDLMMTVSGWVASSPSQTVLPTGLRMTAFRLASTSRYYDRETQEWVDGKTHFFTCRVFRAAAITVAESISKGQPVTVHGRFRTHEWEADSGPRVDLQLDVLSIGHDLTRGIATFARATGDEGQVEPDTDAPTATAPAEADAAATAPAAKKRGK